MSDTHVIGRTQSGGRRLIRQDRYVLVLFLILGTLISSAFLGEGTLGLLIPLAFLSLTLEVTLGTSDVGPRGRLMGRIVLLVSFAGIASAEILNYAAIARLGYFLAMIALSVFTPFVIIRRLSKHLVINIDTVAGAADIYLLIGLFFSIVYATIGAVQAGLFNTLGPANLVAITPASAFFYASRPVGPADFIYYSLVTISTVGYGDLTATSSFARMLSSTEALIGQLYLVTIVAVLVSRLGHARRTPASKTVRESDADPTAEG